MSSPGPKGIDWSAQPLGIEPDRAIAARVGVNINSVRSARRVRGISANRSTPKPSHTTSSAIAFLEALPEDLRARVIAAAVAMWGTK